MARSTKNRKAKVVNAIPLHRDFTATAIANLVYPESVRQTKEGKTYNLAASTVSRIIRATPGVLDLGGGKFWADRIVVPKSKLKVSDSYSSLLQTAEELRQQLKLVEAKLESYEDDIKNFKIKMNKT